MSKTRVIALRQRPARSIPAVLAALIITAIGVVLAWLAITRLATGSWPPVLSQTGRVLSPYSWASGVPIAILVGVLVIGIIMLLTGILPGQYNALAVQAGTKPAVGATDFVITRRAVAKLAAASADQIDGVDYVSATATSRRVQLNVRTASERTDAIKARVIGAVQASLEQAGLSRVPTVGATVSTKND